MREDFSDSIQQEGSRIRRHIDDVVNRDSSQKQLEDLKNSLYFPAMDVRQQDIDVKDREAKTYSWILDEAAEEQSAVRYVQWLQTQGGIYWIQGKAGSG